MFFYALILLPVLAFAFLLSLMGAAPAVPAGVASFVAAAATPVTYFFCLFPPSVAQQWAAAFGWYFDLALPTLALAFMLKFFLKKYV